MEGSRMAKELRFLRLEDISPPSIASDMQVVTAGLALDPELQSVSHDIREALIYSRIDELPEELVDLLAWQFHVDVYEPLSSPKLPLSIKRELVKNSIPLHRKKGTRWAVRKILEFLGFKPVIKEWFEMPEGATPHTFSVSGYYEEDPYNLFFLGPGTEKVLLNAVYAMKPERSHLLHLVIAPPPPDRTNHRCLWDFCTWDHGTRYAYRWGDVESLEIEAGAFPEHELVLGCSLSVGLYGSYIRGRGWDSARWDDGKGPDICDVVGCGVSFGDVVDRDECVSLHPPIHKWHGKRSWRCGGTWRKSCEEDASKLGPGRFTWEE